MNKWDRDNLEFITNLSDKDRNAWLDQADADDIQYALSLIQGEIVRLTIKYEEELDAVNRLSDNFPEAKMFLKKIMEK